MDDSKKFELSDKSFTIKNKTESLISDKNNSDKKENSQKAKENNNLNERIIKLFIGNHPLLSMRTIRNLTNLHFVNKYTKNETYYNSIIIEHIIHNEPGHIVAEFKDFLILGDINEFLQNYYKIKESKYILPKIFEYYINCSVIFPNYVALPESQYIYKNIQKKQKVIDVQQEQEDKEENIKKGLIKQEKKEDIFTTQILDSILNQTDTSGIKQFFGVSNDGNSLGDHLSKIIEGIHYYENNKVSDLKPKYNNYLYKNHQKINFNESFFKNNNDEQSLINGNENKNDTIKNSTIDKDKIKNDDNIKNKNKKEIDLNNNRITKKSVLLLNKKNINNIIDLSNSIKIINEISLNSNRNSAKNGVSLKNINCLGNLIQENANFYTANNDNGGYKNLVNNTTNSKCNTSSRMNKKRKIINISKQMNEQKSKNKIKNICGSDIDIFHSKVIKKSLINSLLNSDKALEISNKDIKNINEKGTLLSNRENTKVSLNTKYYLDSNNKNKNKSKKNKIAIRNINQNINNESEYLYYRDNRNILFSGLSKNDPNIIYKRKKNSDISSYCNKNKLSNSIKNIKIGFKTKNYSSNNILEYKNNISAANISLKTKNKNKENNKLTSSKTKGNISNNLNKLSHHNNIKSNEFLNNKKKLCLDNNLSNGNNKISGAESEKDKIIFKKENTTRNNSDLNKINSYKYKASQYSTYKINNSKNKLNTARFINLDKKITNKSSEKNIKNSNNFNSPRITNSKRLLLKSDLREKITNEDNKRPLTMRESLNNKALNNKVIEVLTNKINQIKEYIKESDKKNKNSISHIFRKKKVGRKKILKENDDIIGMKYGLTERVRNYKLSLNNDISDKRKKIEKLEDKLKNNKNIIKIDKNQLKDMDKIKKTSNSKNKKVNKANKNNKIKNLRNKNNINNGNNYFSDTNYNINFNNCHFHSKNRSELYQNIESNANINNNDNISINNNTELTKENKSIILINNNVKIGSFIKINGFEKLVSKKYATRNIDIPKAVTDRIKNANGSTSQNNSNRYINTSNNNRKKLAKNKIIGTNFFNNV